MPGVRANAGYSSVTPSRARREASAISTKPTAITNNQPVEIRSASQNLRPVKLVPALSRGHKFTYAALFAFTVVLYARPSEFYPSAVTASIALVIGVVTLAFFIPTQLALEGNVSASFVEVKLVILFALVALIGVPLAIDPFTAWQGFSGTFIRCVVMFVVLVNVVRTTARLKGLLFLGMCAAIWLSVGAINDYRLGLLTVEGYRVAGRGTGIFGNTLDMALHLVTMLPLALAFMFGARRKVWRILFALCAALMVAAIALSYSRGAFIGMVATLIFLALRLGRRNRLGIVVGLLVLGIGFLFLAPGNYGVRLLSIFVPSLDPVGSADARRAELLRSLYVAIRHPVLGVGMDNYMTQMSLRGIVTHNSYTQVAAELGLPALALYLSFLIVPLRKVGQIVREAADAAERSRFYFLAVGIEGSLIAYLVASFFLSVPFNWYAYYLVGYAVCLQRIYEATTGKPVVVESRRTRRMRNERVDFSPNSTVGAGQ